MADEQTPVERLTAEIGDILHEWFPSAGVEMATADILDAVARYEAAVTIERLRS